jgi:purine-binding chemotaxis protein CheW
VKLLCFHVAGQDFALPIGSVKETLPERPLTRLFLVPPFVAGLINLRGEVVAVLDLAALLGLAVGGARLQARNIIVLRANLLPGARDPRHAANRPAAGLLVDRLDGVHDLPAEDVKPPPPTLQAESAAYLEGVAQSSIDGSPRRPLLILAPERLLGAERLAPFRRETR